MRELEEEIADWRREMRAGGITAPLLLDELESHLRDDVEQQMRSGLNLQQAFAAAVRRIGQASELQLEFARAGRAPLALRITLRVVAVLFVGFILWLSAFTFLQMKLSLGEQIVAFTAVASSLLVAGSLRYVTKALPVIHKKGRRLAMGAVCILVGCLCASLLSNFVLPRWEHEADGQIPAIGFWLVFPIAVSVCVGLGLAMSARERELWGMNRVRSTTTAGA